MNFPRAGSSEVAERAGERRLLPLWNQTQLWLLTLIFLATLLYAFHLRSTFIFVDESIYYRLAFNLRHLSAFSLDGFHATAIRPPGYPWLLAAIQTVSENVRFAKTVDLLLWPMCAMLLVGVARRLFGQRAASLSLALSLVYVVELYTAGTLYPQAFASFLLLSSLWVEFVWIYAQTTRAAWLQGILWSALILTVPVFLVNLLLYLGWLLYRTHRFRQAACIAILVAATFAGWSSRNRNVLHGFFISDNSGEMLFYGNSAATGANTGPQVPIWLLAPAAFAQKDEVAQEAGYKQAAVAWMRVHPRRAAILYAEKILNWFNCQTNLKTTASHSSAYEMVIALVFYPMLVLAICSPFLLPHRRHVIVFVSAQYLVSAAAYAVFFTRIRYRLPYDYLLMILAGASLAVYLDRRRGKEEVGQTQLQPRFIRVP